MDLFTLRSRARSAADQSLTALPSTIWSGGALTLPEAIHRWSVTNEISTRSAATLDGTKVRFGVTHVYHY